MRASVALLIAEVGLLASLTAPCLATEFSEPWKDPHTVFVIDPFAGNPIDWDQLARDARVVGIIHKATVGTQRIDPKYYERRTEARRRGYLWGSYHFGTPGSGAHQADYYLDKVKPGADELIALDLEDVSDAKFMSTESAVQFVQRVKERTGRLPLIYASQRSVALIAKSEHRRSFEGTRLWFAWFRPQIAKFPPGPWRTYTLWQFSSEIRVQYRVPGTKPDMDVNVFNGTVDELKKAWPFHP